MKSLSEGDELPLYKVKENENQRQNKARLSDYFRSGGRYLDSCCNVLLSLKCILNPIEIIISIVVVISIVVAM